MGILILVQWYFQTVTIKMTRSLLSISYLSHSSSTIIILVPWVSKYIITLIIFQLEGRMVRPVHFMEELEVFSLLIDRTIIIPLLGLLFHGSQWCLEVLIKRNNSERRLLAEVSQKVCRNHQLYMYLVLEQVVT